VEPRGPIFWKNPGPRALLDGKKTKSMLIGPSQKKKVETMEAFQNRRFYGMVKCFPLWPSYIAEKGRTLGKTYGIKARCYWEHP
jgi:hypothetical protein